MTLKAPKRLLAYLRNSYENNSVYSTKRQNMLLRSAGLQPADLFTDSAVPSLLLFLLFLLLFFTHQLSEATIRAKELKFAQDV